MFQTRGPAALKAPSPKFGVRATDEKHTSVSRAQSSWTGVSDEAAVVSQVAWSGPRQRLVDQGGDLKLHALPHWKQCN